MMDNEGTSHHEGSVSPCMFSSVKQEPSDSWNPPFLHSANGMVENYTYAALEPVYPDTPYSHGPQYYAYANPSSCIQSLYPSPMQDDSDFFTVQPTVYREGDLAKDEGLGSSPSSFNSSSPPLNLPTTVTDQPPVSLSSANNFDCQRSNERSSPEDLAYEEYAPPECGNCGSRIKVTWYTNHYLCGECYMNRVQSVVVHQTDDDSPNDRKRKRSATVNKKDNQSCTNCGTISTTLWRRSSNGTPVCNACGLYEKLHKKNRPQSMRKDNIQKRKRKPKEPQNRQRKKSTSKAQTGIQRVQQPSNNNMEQYTLPTYNSIQMRNLPLNLNPVRNTEPLPPINGNAFNPFIRPDMYGTMYHSVPPNEIISSARVLTPSITSSPTGS